MLRLHHSPLACSLASRLALSEAGLAHEIVFVDTLRGKQRSEAYRRINPRGQVPALETSQGVLTESAAILPYIADVALAKGLFPSVGDSFARAQGQSWLCFLSSALHPAAQAAMFLQAGHENAQARAASVERLAFLLADIDAILARRDHLLDTFGVCDLYLFVFTLWRTAPAIAGQLPPLPNLDRFQQRILARSGIAAIVAEEVQLREGASRTGKESTP